MSAISQDLARIDSAKYGEEVRGSIHHAIEQCYTDVTTAETLANTAANNANTKAGLADAATTRANQAAATAENFTGLVAPTYSTSAIYAVGDYVVYNGAMYRCITAIDTAEAWTAAHWTAVNTGAEVTDLKSALNNVVDISSITWENNKSIDTSGNIISQNNDLASDYIEVKPMSHIHIQGVDIRTARNICGYDINKNFVKCIVIGNTNTYSTVSSDVNIVVDYRIHFIRIVKHNSIASISMQYINITDDIYDMMFNDRQNIQPTVMARYINTGTFDPSTSMPFESWWYGVWSQVKDVFLNDGTLSQGCPFISQKDTSAIKITKKRFGTENGVIYLFELGNSAYGLYITEGGTFKWKNYTIKTIENSVVKITSANKTNYFTDANDAPVNRWFEIQSSAKIENTPYGNGGTTAAGIYTEGVRSFAGYLNGTLFTFNTSTYVHQIFISLTENATTPEPTILFFRSKYYSGVWTDWKKLSSDVSLSATNIAIRKKMIARYLDENDQPTATDTGVPNPQYMGDDPLIFNDFNDAPRQSIYQIDLDCDATVMSNNPKPGVSSVLITIGFSHTVRHGTVQLCVGINGNNTFAYIRYGYQQSSNTYMWTNWTDLVGLNADTTIIVDGRLIDGSDLNSISGNKLYLLGDNAGYLNAPLDLTYGFITTKQYGIIKHQTIETSSNIYLRIYNGSNWSSWVKK